MKKYKFNNNDSMPALGLGTWKSEPGEVYQAVIDAVKNGYRHIDCAPIYGNEPEIGEALQNLFSNGIVKRGELWITSKLWNNAHAKDRVEPALKKTLNDLQIDYLDLFLIHWPINLNPEVLFPEQGTDMLSLDEIPIIETWQGMERCLENGLTHHIGVSNFSIKKLKDMIGKADTRPEVNQIELHPYLQQTNMLDFCNTENIILTAYSPLGSKDRAPGMKADNEPDMLKNPVITEIAETHNCSPAQVLLSWAINRGTSVIPKSVNTERIKQNFEARNIDLSEEDMRRIAGLDRHFRFINGEFWAMEGSPYSVNDIWDE